jgi:hypothetical protein
MPIEWGQSPGHETSAMGAYVVDNSLSTITVLDTDEPFNIRVEFEVPNTINPFVNSGHTFRLRAYAESIGPGPEVQLGATLPVTGVTSRKDYEAVIAVPANTLVGEGGFFNGVLVSGVYKIVVVLQHLNGIALEDSGYTDAGLIQIRLP